MNEPSSFCKFLCLQLQQLIEARSKDVARNKQEGISGAREPGDGDEPGDLLTRRLENPAIWDPGPSDERTRRFKAKSQLEIIRKFFYSNYNSKFYEKNFFEYNCIGMIIGPVL